MADIVRDAAARRLRDAWEPLRERYAVYDLLLPGDPSFICQAQACDAHCCRKFSVSVGDADRERMERTTGLAPIEFLEADDGEPVILPLAKPYLLKRAENRCALLGDDLACTRYEGRPDACRQYPYQVIFATADGQPARLDLPAARNAVSRTARGTEPGAAATALLLRHTECPGFTGPPITQDGWVALLLSTFDLQAGG